MRPAVFFRRPSKIRTSGERGSPAPDDLSSTRNTRCKDLVFEITVQQPGALYHVNHPTRLSHVASERLFASNADQFSFSGPDCIVNGLHMLQAQMVWRAEPKAVYLRRGNHLFNRIESPGVTHAKPAGEIGCRFSMPVVWTVYAEHISIAHANPGLNVKARHKSAADESNSESRRSHRSVVSFSFTCKDFVSDML